MDDEFARFQAELAGMGGDDDGAAPEPAPKKQKVISATIMRAPQKAAEPPNEPPPMSSSSSEPAKQPAPPDFPPHPPHQPPPPPMSADQYYANPKVMMSSNSSNPIGYQQPFNPATVAHLPEPERNAATQASVYEYVPGTKSFQPKGSAPLVPAKPKEKKTVIRAAAGKTWKDESLSEWPDDDFRLFVGDLGNEVTDELLAHAFAKFSSFQKAKVIRNKFTHKSKGFGFLSFRDPIECAKALREMNGKYCGNRPMKLTRSKWKDRNVEEVRKKNKEKKKQSKRGVF